MKKLLLALLSALVLLCFCGAIAEGRGSSDTPTDPHLQRIIEISRQGVPKRNLASDIRMYLSGELVIPDSGVTQSGSWYSGRTWTVNPSGGSGDYQYDFFICEEDSPFDNSSVCYHQDYSSDNSVTYQFLVPGDYYFLCHVRDSAGASTSYYKTFTVPADGHNTLDEVVSGLVAECRAAGCTEDYEIALWLHDWLTHNNYYDLEYHYYGADSALLRGRCVCDGYSKAYYLLLKAAGISVDRALSDNHAWNVAKLDRKWYQIDVTWDDPSGAETAVSGSERHIYFGLPDALMTDHEPYQSPATCTSYDDNYFIRSGKVSMWVDLFTDKIDQQLGDSYWGVIHDIPERYPSEKSGWYSTGKEPIVYGLTAYQLSRTGWPYRGGTMPLNAFYVPESRKLHVLVRVEDSQLELPAQLTEIAEESFMDDNTLMGVRIPEGVTTIGKCAFSGCTNLWAAFVPDSVTYIANDAFWGDVHVNIVCHRGSYAESYAIDHKRILAIID